MKKNGEGGTSARRSKLFKEILSLQLILSLTFFLFLSAVSFGQQTRTITGSVTDEQGNPLPGVSIVVEGTTIGVITNIDGEYTLDVPADAETLVYSFVGMQTQEIAIGNQTQINVELSSDVLDLETVVVTGYSTERKKDIIGSVSVVDVGDMTTAPTSDPTAQLQGRVSGVTVSTDGSLGSDTKVRIRGFGSFSGSDPLYIIDGVPGDMDALNPNDIESVQVLKDAASASIYGARAASGVIIITTKQGQAGRSSINFDAYYGINTFNPNNYPELMDAQEYGEYLWRSYEGAGYSVGDAQWGNPAYGYGANPVIPEYLYVRDAGTSIDGATLEDLKQSNPTRFAELVDPANYDFQTHQIVKSGNTDWFDEVFNPAPVQSYSLSGSGGSESGTYLLAVSYFDQESTTNEYGRYQRYTARANSNLNATDWLRIGETMQINYSTTKGGGDGSTANAWTMTSIIPVYDIMGNVASSAAPGVVDVGDHGRSPISQNWRSRFNKDWSAAIMGSFFVDITPIPDLVLTSRFGYNIRTPFDQNVSQLTYEHAENTTGHNNVSGSARWNSDWTWSNTANYSKTIDRHVFRIMVGTEAYRDYSWNISGQREDILISDDPNYLTLDTPTGAQSIGGSWSRVMLYSLLSRIDYTFDDKYIFNATVRRDGSSKFGINNRYGYFPSAAIGWRISSEDFMADADWVDDLKLRASYGILGNQTGLSAGNQYTRYESALGESYNISGSGSDIATSYTMDFQGNPDARWEQTEIINAGFDATLFDGSWTIGGEYFVKTTKDLLVTNNAPLTAADVSQPRVNVGDIQNKGIELTVTKRGNLGDLQYDATMNFSHYKNEVLKYLDNPESYVGGGSTRIDGDVVRTTAGWEISTYYGYVRDGFFNTPAEVDAYNAAYENEILPAEVGRWRLKDISGPDGVPDNVIDDNDMTILGSPHPDFQASLNLNLAYKGFDLNAFVFWNQGGNLFNGIRRWTDFPIFSTNRSDRMLYDSWTPNNQNAMLPKLDATDTYSGRYSVDYFVEDASYVRLRTIQLGYTIPSSVLNRINVSRLRLYVQAQNLFTITKFSGLDPGVSIQGNDTSMGIINNQQPTPVQLLFGINLGL